MPKTLKQLEKEYGAVLNLPLVPRHQPDERMGDFVGARSAKVLAVLYPPVKKRGGRLLREAPSAVLSGDDKPMCQSRSRQSYICELIDGHDGPHRAFVDCSERHQIAWSSEDRSRPASGAADAGKLAPESTGTLEAGGRGAATQGLKLATELRTLEGLMSRQDQYGEYWLGIVRQAADLLSANDAEAGRRAPQAARPVATALTSVAENLEAVVAENRRILDSGLDTEERRCYLRGRIDAYEFAIRRVREASVAVPAGRREAEDK